MNEKAKNRNPRISTPQSKQGVALMAVVITLVIVALMMTAIAWQIIANRRMLDHREYELQAAWLARAGGERAAARLLVSPDGFVEEATELLPASSVRIEVKPEPDAPGVYRITCEARYPTDVVDRVSRSFEKRINRQVSGGIVRLECITAEK